MIRQLTNYSLTDKAIINIDSSGILKTVSQTPFQSILTLWFSSVKLLSRVWRCAAPWTVIEFFKNQVGTKLSPWLALRTKVGFGKWQRQNKLIFSITFTKMIGLTNSKPVFYFQIKLKFAVKIATDMQIIKYKTRDFLT